jgi:nitroimidazol reductase NimA-like FMN-containing flavoprotein (pyridoxamine 5'-phosphate oxidase superfamily)
MQAETPREPTFRDLSEAEAVALLERNMIGRLAFTFRDRVDVQPLLYVHDGGWLYGRTEAGDKIVTLTHNQWVAFEVDEVTGPFDWQSVVVRGSFYRLDEEDRADPEVRAHALRLLRRFVPETLRPGDPVPHRTVLFRIDVREMTGRACSTGARPVDEP